MENEQQLLALWKQIFGEYDGFWELFLAHGYSPDRCRYLQEEGQLTAALCWFDCSCRGEKWAYLYAVMTHPAHRGRGLCRKLMTDTHAHLKKLGYAGVLLVPAEEGLRAMYEKMGYRTCTRVSEISCEAGTASVPMRPVSPEEYARLRRQLLPEGGAVQEGANLAFLAAQAELLAGKDILLAAWREGDTLHGMELLGDAAQAPGIVKALGCARGSFRVPGGEIPFAMGMALENTAALPGYFGFAFD